MQINRETPTAFIKNQIGDAALALDDVIKALKHIQAAPGAVDYPAQAVTWWTSSRMTPVIAQVGEVRKLLGLLNDLFEE